MATLLMEKTFGCYTLAVINEGWGAKEIKVEVWVKDPGGRQHMPHAHVVYDNWFYHEKSAMRVVDNFRTLIAATLITGDNVLTKADFKEAAYQHRKRWRAK